MAPPGAGNLHDSAACPLCVQPRGCRLAWYRLLQTLKESRALEGARAAADEALAREREQNDIVRAELKAIKRRAPALSPLYALSDQRFAVGSFPGRLPRQRIERAGNDPRLLSLDNDAVPREVAAGEPIALLVENQGRESHNVTIETEGATVALTTFEASGTHGIFAIVYPFQPEKVGARQIFRIGFLSHDGIPDVHRYESVHGQRVLRRVEPA